MNALFGWFRPAEIYHPTDFQWLAALKLSGYRGTFVRLPASTVRALAKSRSTGY